MGNRNLRAVSGINNYADAKKLYDSIKPLRTTGIRHIGSRASSNRMSVREDENSDIVFRLHNTDCVRYCKDGELHITRGNWPTTSTAQFLHALSPCGVRVFINQHQIWIQRFEDLAYFLVPSGLLKIKGGVVLNPVPQYNLVLNKEKTKELRAKLKPIFKRCDGIMSATTPSEGLYHNVDYEGEYELARRVLSGESEDDIVIHVLKLCLTVVNLWRPRQQVYWNREPVYANIRNSLYSISKAYDEVELPVGKMPSAPKAWAP